MTHFPKIRRLISACAIAAPCLLFSSFLLFARGLLLLGAVAAVLALFLFLAFPPFIAVRQSLQPASIASSNDLGGWVSWLGKYGVFLWAISQPEFTAFQNRVIHGGALWDGWLIAPIAVLTAYSIYVGLKQVPQITDAAIYSYFNSDDEHAAKP